MAPSKPFPSVSRIIDERFEQKAMEIHLRKLEAVKAVVDTSEPQYMHHLDHNAKKAERDAERRLEVEQENARLFNKLAAIEDFDSTKVLRSSNVRSSLNANPGLFYSTVGGYQCIDHINLTATANPRSLHYKGPSVPASRASTRGPSRANTCPASPEREASAPCLGGGEGGHPARVESMEDWQSTPHGVGRGVMHVRGGARDAQDEEELAALGLAQRCKSSSASGARAGGAGHLGARMLRPPLGPGAAYLAASVPPPAPPKSSAMGPQQWSGQLARSRRTTGDGNLSSSVDFGAETRSFRLSAASGVGGTIGAECSLPLIGRSSLRASKDGRRDGRDSLQTSADLQEEDADGADGLSAARGSDAAAAAAMLLAQPPSAPPPPRSRPGPSRGASSSALQLRASYNPGDSLAAAASSPYASPHRPPRPGAGPSASRGGSPSRIQTSRCDAPLPPSMRAGGSAMAELSTSRDLSASRDFLVGGGSRAGSLAGSRCASPLRQSLAGSRGASPLRRSMQGDTDGDATYSFAPDHGLRKEMLKVAYLQGANVANVQVKGNTVMATRRSTSYSSLCGAGGTPAKGPRYSNSMDDDEL